MVPADHPVNGQVFTKAPPTGPADIRVTFTRWNDQYLSCQPVPDQLLPSLSAVIHRWHNHHFAISPSIFAHQFGSYTRCINMNADVLCIDGPVPPVLSKICKSLAECLIGSWVSG